MRLVIDTTFCGAWAGEAWATSLGCSALAPMCEKYVAKNPKAFRDAFWLVEKVKVYEEKEGKRLRRRVRANEGLKG